MPERPPEFFRSQIARINRLLTGVTDHQTMVELKRLAEEYQAKAAEAERREKQCEHGPE
jgi:hypothetical protein